MKSTVVLSLLLSGAACLALPAAAASSGSVDAVGNRVPLGKKHTVTGPTGKANLPGFFASLNSTLVKYGRAPLPYYAPVAEAQQAQQAQAAEKKKKRRHRKRQANEPLTDQYEGDSEDAAYYGEVVVGSGDGNPQTFGLIFDTGSADLWYVDVTLLDRILLI